MQLEGVTGKPYNTPQVRKKVPLFSRPRIDLDGGRRVKREWQDISILKVVKGDTVAGFGTVESTVEFIQVADGAIEETTWRVRLYNVMGDYKDYPGHDRVFAFTAEPVPVDD